MPQSRFGKAPLWERHPCRLWGLQEQVFHDEQTDRFCQGYG